MYGRIGYRQAAILYAIRHDLIPSDDVTPTRLATFFEVQPSVVTRALARLEVSQFIERVSDPRDGRRCYIQVTEKGKQVSELVEELFTKQVLDSIEFLDDDQIDELRRNVEILNQVAESLEENLKGRSAGSGDPVESPDQHSR